MIWRLSPRTNQRRSRDLTLTAHTLPYTLWSHDTRLGESDLDLPAPRPGMLLGAFRPAAAGLSVLPLFVEVTSAGLALGPMLEREGLTRERLGDGLGAAIHDALPRTSEGRRYAAACAAIDALGLRLRDAAGAVVAARGFALSDLWQLGPGLAGLPPEAHAAAESVGLARYSLSVMLPLPDTTS